MTIVDSDVRTIGLLTAQQHVPLPHLSYAELEALLRAADLTGRGGAGFPTARKLAGVRSAAGRRQRPVVVGNAMEGEFLSHKDAVLLRDNPDLVLDGLQVLGGALDAKRRILAVGPDIDPAPVEQAAIRRGGFEVRPLDGGFVAGQESALVNRLDGGPGVPTDPVLPVWRRGVDGRPTMVSNAETLAQIGLLARYGADWFRSRGTPEDPGTFLATVSGSSQSVVSSPGVVEVGRGIALRELLTLAGTDLRRVQAVLVGGYHGTWVTDLDVRLSRPHLAAYGASPGAGVVHVLDRGHCPLIVSAHVVDYLAGQSARQCGPCVNGLPRMADALSALAEMKAGPQVRGDIERLRALVVGRGACAHPDGTARLVSSTMTVFADHVNAHLAGVCPR